MMFSPGDTSLKCFGVIFRDFDTMIAGIRERLLAPVRLLFVASRDVTASDNALGMKGCDTDFCAVSTVSVFVSWFSSSAFEYVWTVLINVSVLAFM